MTIGKNKKKGKKGAKKRVDPMTKKEWYQFKVPAPFEQRNEYVGLTCVNRSEGLKIASKQLEGRVVTLSLADLKSQNEQNSWKKIKLIIEDVDGKSCRTTFNGLDITRDKLCSSIRKWHSLIEAHCEVKTNDGFIMRVFIIGFTKHQANLQKRKTSYAYNSQKYKIRKVMREIINKEASSSNLVEFVTMLITEKLGQDIEHACRFIYPLQNVIVRKVKMLKRPKLELAKINEMYTDIHKHEGPKQQAKKINIEEESQNLLTK